MTKELISRPDRTDGKAILGSDNTTMLNNLEKIALSDLDKDKINDLAKCLFTLNNRKYGPIPGAYMVMCTKPGKEWCVAQLNADRAKPFEKLKKKLKELKKSEVNQHQDVVLNDLKRIRCPKNLFGYLFLYCCMPFIVFSGV